MRPPALPRALTSFIGRDADIAAVLALLDRDGARLVTLTGPGGVGKTRLAIEVAARIGGALDGVWFVPLAPIDDPDLVGAVIATVIGAPHSSAASATDRIAAHVGASRALLVVDNFEQVMDAAGLIVTLIHRCPQLRLIVTSRAVLRLSPEYVYAVPPLQVPLAPNGGDLAAFLASDAIRLFVDRARARRPDFALTANNAGAVAAICRRLDGLPLGIELAAARVSILTPQEVLERIDARLAVLSDGPSDQPGRLRSLRESIVWSHELLSPDEQRLFRRLGVFAGVWTLAAAEAILYGPGERRTLPVLDGVASLIDKNLVRQVDRPGGRSQYLMLMTIREFAAELLAASGEEDAIRERFSRWLAGIAEEAFFALYRPDGAELYATLELYAADLVRCLAAVEADGDAEVIGQLTRALEALWSRGEHAGDSAEPLLRAVARAREAGSPTLGRILTTLALVHHLRGAEGAAWVCIEEALPLLEDARDRLYQFMAHTYRGLIAQRHGGVREAEADQLRALEVLRAIPDLPWRPFAESTVLGHLGNNAIIQGDIPAARESFARALAIQAEHGYEPGTSHYAASHPIAGLGDADRADGEQSAALARYQQALRLACGVGDYRARVYAIGGVAAALACLGDWETAARLFGASQALHERAGIHFGMETFDRQRGLGLPEPWLDAGRSFATGQPIHDALWGDRPVPFAPIPDPAGAEALWRAGRELSLVEATAEALAARDPASRPAPAPQPATTSGLSRRELEVLRLLVDGRTDGEIAGELFISRRTAATHLRHIYDKLGVSSRASAAAWAVRNGIA